MTARTAILIASLAVNLFLVGFLVSGVVARQPVGGFGIGVLREAAAVLPEGAQADLRTAFEAEREEIRLRMEGVVDARWAVRDAFLEDPYDPARVRQALSRLRQETGAVQEVLQDTLAEAAADLTPRQRRQFLRELGRQLRGEGRGQGAGGGAQR